MGSSGSPGSSLIRGSSEDMVAGDGPAFIGSQVAVACFSVTLPYAT